MPGLTVAEIWRFPVKSTQGEKLAFTEITPLGIPGDRQFAVYDHDTMKLYSRKQLHAKKLAEVTSSIEGEYLKVSHPRLGELKREIIYGDEDVSGLQVLSDQVGGVSQDPEFTLYFTSLLNRVSSLVMVPKDNKRLVDPEFVKSEHYTTYTDGYPLTIVSQETLDTLSQYNGLKTTNEQIRANIIIAGAGEPYIEDYLRRFSINETEFKVAKACSRSIMTEHFVNPLTGEVERIPVTLRSLRQMGRVGFNGTIESAKPMLAENTLIENGGFIGVNNDLKLIEIADIPNFYTV